MVVAAGRAIAREGTDFLAAFGAIEVGECMREQLAPDSTRTLAASRIRGVVGFRKSLIISEMLEMILTLAIFIEFGQVNSRYFSKNGLWTGAPQL